MPQYTFSAEESLIKQVDELAIKDTRSRSEMIYILLQLAIKEKTRKRNAKKDHTEYSAGDMGKSNTTG